VIALTQNMARRLAQAHIRVNCVVPGFTDTPMNQASFAQRAGGDPASEATLRRDANVRIPLGRLAGAEEVASVIGFLLSPDSGGSRDDGRRPA
jgi:3-oxoacyl-[acyl-carrier protein] reductase